LTLGHGLEDLAPDERAAYERPAAATATKTETRYVRVTEPEFLAGGLMSALEAEAKANSHYWPLVERVKRMGKHIADSARAAERMHPTHRPQDIVMQGAI
jgi:hypothetical protein